MGDRVSYSIVLARGSFLLLAFVSWIMFFVVCHTIVDLFRVAAWNVAGHPFVFNRLCIGDWVNFRSLEKMRHYRITLHRSTLTYLEVGLIHKVGLFVSMRTGIIGRVRKAGPCHRHRFAHIQAIFAMLNLCRLRWIKYCLLFDTSHSEVVSLES